MSADSETGYFIECDIHYPEHLHDAHNAYPLAPEHLHIDSDMLSDTLRFMLNETGVEHVPCSNKLWNFNGKRGFKMISVKDYIKLSTTLSLLTRVTINNLLTYCEIYLVGSPKNNYATKM